MSEVIILTGKTASGKTTFITNWLKRKENIAGILTLTKNGKRVFWDVTANVEKRFEVDESFNGPVLKIGQFMFDEEAFNWATAQINDLDFSSVDYFVLDEAGPIELNKNGFYNAIINLLQIAEEKKVKIIFVVREQCVDKFIELFSLKDVNLYTKENFNC